MRAFSKFLHGDKNKKKQVPVTKKEEMEEVLEKEEEKVVVEEEKQSSVLEWVDRKGNVRFEMEGVVTEKPRQKLGILTPQAYMAAELKKLTTEYDIVPVAPDEGDWSEDTIKYWAKYLEERDVPAVVGFAQRDAWHHALINMALGNVSISSLAFLVAMNKFMQRAISPDKDFWFAPVDPDVEEDNDALIAKIPETEWPFMLKNTSLSLGRGVFKCKTPERMAEILDMYRSDKDLRAMVQETNGSITSRMTEKEWEECHKIVDVPPPFIAEHMVDLTAGWIEYCYEGCVDEAGNVSHYALTEECYFEDGTGLAYVTPPLSYDSAHMRAAEKYIEDYMSAHAGLGYRKQFFNIEFWCNGAEDPEGGPEFLLCEINPRCAHTYHYGYMFAYGTNLYRDNFELVLNDTLPEDTPWKAWGSGEGKFTTEMLITIMNQTDDDGNVLVDVASMAAKDIVDYDLVAKLIEDGELNHVRYVKDANYKLTDADANSASGTTLMQVWFTTDTAPQAAAKEMELRKQIYKVEQPSSVYPKFWTDMAAKAE